MKISDLPKFKREDINFELESILMKYHCCETPGEVCVSADDGFLELRDEIINWIDTLEDVK